MKNAIIPIDSADEDNDSYGTGFIIHSEAGVSLLLTCAHVLKDVGGKDKVRAGGYPAEVVINHEPLDVAVLKITEELPGKRWLDLKAAASSGSKFTTIGIRRLPKQFETAELKGQLGNQNMILPKGSPEGCTSWELIMNDPGTLQRGSSGSPVVDEDGFCIGMVNYREGIGQKGIAISVEVLTMVWPERPPSVLPTIQPVHGKTLPSTSKLDMDREEECELFRKIADGRDPETKILILQGEAGVGKTYLLERYEQIARPLNWRTFRFMLGKQTSIDQFLTQVVDHFPHGCFGSFEEYSYNPIPETSEKRSEWYRILTQKFFNDLREVSSDSKLVILMDKCENADPIFKGWLDESFLPRICHSKFIIVVLAGWEEATRDLKERRELCRVDVKGLSRPYFDEYAAARGVALIPEQIDSLHGALSGKPKLFVDYIDGLAKQSSRGS